MATDKRERQRQNREAKKAAEEKAAKRRRRIALAKRWSIYVAIFIIAIVVLRLLAG